MLELWQTEWCPASRRIRQQLTELGVDYVSRQVPVEKEQRRALLEKTGSDTIPALVGTDGTTISGENDICRYLDGHFAVPPGAEAHRLKAARARRRYLEEECECWEPATR
jgi:glutathione S-transferase